MPKLVELRKRLDGTEARAKTKLEAQLSDAVKVNTEALEVKLSGALRSLQLGSAEQTDKAIQALGRLFVDELAVIVQDNHTNAQALKRDIDVLSAIVSDFRARVELSQESGREEIITSLSSATELIQQVNAKEFPEFPTPESVDLGPISSSLTDLHIALIEHVSDIKGDLVVLKKPVKVSKRQFVFHVKRDGQGFIDSVVASEV